MVSQSHSIAEMDIRDTCWEITWDNAELWQAMAHQRAKPPERKHHRQKTPPWTKTSLHKKRQRQKGYLSHWRGKFSPCFRTLAHITMGSLQGHPGFGIACRYDRLMALNHERPERGRQVMERLQAAEGSVSIVIQRPVIRRVKVKRNGLKDLGAFPWIQHYPVGSSVY